LFALEARGVTAMKEGKKVLEKHQIEFIRLFSKSKK
jgi:hypothetical protein